MSKAFAEEILNTQDPQVLRKKLQQRPSEVDDAFIQQFLQTADELAFAGDTGEAASTLQLLYSCGTYTQRILPKVRALYVAALLDIKQQGFIAAVKRIGRCIDECAKAPDQCAHVEVDALILLATLQFEHEGDPDKAIETLQRAAERLTNLQDTNKAAEVQRRIADISREKENPGEHPTLVEVLLDILNARSRRNELLHQIDELSSTLSTIRAEIASIDGRRTEAAAEIANLQAQTTSLTATRDELQSRQRLFATALAAPLWIAAVRADIHAGRITELTLPLLERLRTAMPEHAQPLIAQIRARNSLAPDQPINLDGLAGEERLFAAVANSLTLDPAADPAAFESLLDAWDTYLSTPAGNSP